MNRLSAFTKKRRVATAVVLTLVLIATLGACGNDGGSGGGKTLDAAGTVTLLTENKDVWFNEKTAGMALIDIDFDGTPELLVTETDFRYYEELDADYFGDSTVTLYSLADNAVTKLGSYITDEYCFMATIQQNTAADGSKGWYYTSGGEVYTVALADGALSVASAAEMPDITGGDEPFMLLRNEVWVSVSGEQAGFDTVVTEDITAIAEEMFGAAG